MTELFNRGELRDFLANRVQSFRKLLESMPEDEVLARTTDDLVPDLVGEARIEAIAIGADAVDGGVTEIRVDIYDHFDGRRFKAAGREFTPRNLAAREYAEEGADGLWRVREHLASVHRNHWEVARSPLPRGANMGQDRKK